MEGATLVVGTIKHILQLKVPLPCTRLPETLHVHSRSKLHVAVIPRTACIDCNLCQQVEEMWFHVQCIAASLVRRYI